MIKIYIALALYFIALILLIAFSCWKILLGIFIACVIWIAIEIKRAPQVPDDLADLF